jgi:seryl-tRNA synthetase
VLDLKRIRQDPGAVRAALQRRGSEAVAGLDRVIELDARRRELLPQLEGLRAEQNDANARIKSAGSAEEREREIAAMRGVAARAKELERELNGVEEDLQGALAPLPNLPDPTAAPGPEDELVRDVGEIPTLAFEPRDHLELAGERIDMDRAARLSGSRFAYLKGDLVMLELALVRWVLEKLRGKGFEPVIPPVLVRERALFGTGFLPDTEQQIYSLPEDDLYLVGTSEVALASLHAEEILDAERLPLRYAGCATPASRPAFAARPARREKTRGGSSGCTSSTRWRCSASSRLRTQRASTSGSSRSRRRSSGS